MPSNEREEISEKLDLLYFTVVLVAIVIVVTWFFNNFSIVPKSPESIVIKNYQNPVLSGVTYKYSSTSKVIACAQDKNNEEYCVTLEQLYGN